MFGKCNKYHIIIIIIIDRTRSIKYEMLLYSDQYLSPLTSYIVMIFLKINKKEEENIAYAPNEYT